VGVRFRLESDQGLELGGWAIDDLCLVGWVPTVCGDGQLTGIEICDDGPDNSDDNPDACRSDCTAPRCGDGVSDAGEDCDDENQVAGDGCELDCRPTPAPPPPDPPPAADEPPSEEPPDPGGCACALPRRPPSGGWSLLPWWAAVAVALRRRRRALAPAMRDYQLGRAPAARAAAGATSAWGRSIPATTA
jgi:cysteine-rich repeat protein